MTPSPLNYDSPTAIRAFLDARGLAPLKRYGQNFLVNPSIRQRLLDALDPQPGDETWEIGPGLGAMTHGLLSRSARVTAFEIDPAYARVLEEFFGDGGEAGSEGCENVGGAAPHTPCREGAPSRTHPQGLEGGDISPPSSPSMVGLGGRGLPAGGVGGGAPHALAPPRPPAFTLVRGDVLRTWPGVGVGGEALLLGNLPYQIAAVLLADFIERGRLFRRCVVTVQREVAERIAARPGTRGYSSLSVLCASAYRVTPLMTIHGAAFYPVPRVESRALRLDLLPAADRAAYPPAFRPLVRALFGARRKTVRNNLACFLGPAGDPDAALSRAGLSGERRAETFTLEEFTRLAAALGA